MQNLFNPIDGGRDKKDTHQEEISALICGFGRKKMPLLAGWSRSRVNTGEIDFIKML